MTAEDFRNLEVGDIIVHKRSLLRKSLNTKGLKKWIISKKNSRSFICDIIGSGYDLDENKWTEIPYHLSTKYITLEAAMVEYPEYLV